MFVINDIHITDTMSLEYENDHLRFLFFLSFLFLQRLLKS